MTDTEITAAINVYDLPQPNFSSSDIANIQSVDVSELFG